jgi:uroporphyrinogen decarboxylase
MFGAPEVWFALVDRIADATVEYVRSQVSAGAQAVQLFDSWAGSLAPLDYDIFVAPWARRILKAIRTAGVPAIHFAATGAALLERLAEDADVVGIDAGQSLRAARARLPATAIQGNLDPARLAAGPRAITAGVERVLAEAANAPGHVFNTGHAVPRDTSPGILAGIVDLVHERTARAATELVGVSGPAAARHR